MAGYWPSSLFAFLWTETKSRSIKRKKRTRPIPSRLDRTNLVNERFIIWHKGVHGSANSIFHFFHNNGKIIIFCVR